jgi:hypothetical protein
MSTGSRRTLDVFLARMPPEKREKVRERADIILRALDDEGALIAGPIRDAWALYAAGLALPWEVAVYAAARRAFYAGASAFFDITMMQLEEGDDDMTPGDEQLLTHITEEFENMCRLIAQGRM